MQHGNILSSENVMRFAVVNYRTLRLRESADVMANS